MSSDLEAFLQTADAERVVHAAAAHFGRIAEVEEVADLVTYLASPKAHFVNGTMIEIDGGQMKPIMDAMRDQV
jgi:NAD(P)-dependent dehydrogenase (short-subunit alcohol dehydrogenase family)